MDPVALLQQWLEGYFAEPPDRPRRPPTGAGAPGGRNRAARPADREASGKDEFWRIWIEHVDDLRKQTLRLMGGNVSEAEDALSNAALKGYGAFKPGQIGNERAWLSRIVYTACMDQYRLQKRQGTVMEREGLERIAAERPGHTVQGRSPEDEYLAGELIVEFVQQLLELPDTLLEPLLMRCLADMAYSEISDRLEVTNATARKRVELARNRLRKSGFS